MGEERESCTVHEGLRKLVQLLPQVTRGLRRSSGASEALEDCDLGPRHGSALSLLRERGSLTVGALASELGLTLATVSGVVADLDKVGFVQRRPDPADRRRTIVGLCPERQADVDAWLDGATAPIERALDKLSAEERAVFVKAMQYLQAELNPADGAPRGAVKP